jgi:putative transposase
MVGDITYIPTWQGWVFLATVIDCYTKAVIGWAMSDTYKTPLISAAIGMAVRNHAIKNGAIFHSDRGSNGEFHRSSQHLECGGVDGSAGRVDEGVDGQVADEVARGAGVAARSRAFVLA